MLFVRNEPIFSEKGISRIPRQMSKNFSPQKLLVLNHILHLLEFILCPKWIACLHFHSVSLVEISLNTKNTTMLSKWWRCQRSRNLRTRVCSLDFGLLGRKVRWARACRYWHYPSTRGECWECDETWGFNSFPKGIPKSCSGIIPPLPFNQLH